MWDPAKMLPPEPARPVGWLVELAGWVADRPSVWPLLPVVFLAVEFHLFLWSVRDDLLRAIQQLQAVCR